MERKVILYIAATLDGFIASTDGGVSFLDKYNDKLIDFKYAYDMFIKNIDTVIMGNTTYEQVKTFGPWPYDEMTNYVFSRSKKEIEHGIVVDNSIELVKKLKNKTGKDIWLVGGASLTKTFLDSNLIDEIMLFIMPETIGDGIKLFQGSINHFKLIDAISVNDIAYLHYKK
jgi:dihydrofolate reductase